MPKAVWNGTVIAESNDTIVVEGNHYFPRGTVNDDYLIPSDLQSRCPYKGQAAYWSVKIGDQVHTNIIWGYPDPIPENPKIRGLVCFFNERVDLYVDGVFQRRPITPWS